MPRTYSQWAKELRSNRRQHRHPPHQPQAAGTVPAATKGTPESSAPIAANQNRLRGIVRAVMQVTLASSVQNAGSRNLTHGIVRAVMRETPESFAQSAANLNRRNKWK